MCQLEIPRITFVANSIQNQRHFPLWDPHVWAGIPVLGSGQPGPLFPLTILLEILPLQNGKISFLSLNFIFLLQRVLTGFFTSLFLREIGLKPLPATLGGILFAAGGYTGSLPWLDLSNAVVCVPLIALFAIRLARNPRSISTAAALGVALGFSWLSGHHEIPLLTTYALLLGFGIQTWRLMPLSLAIAAAVSAIQTLPLLEFGHHAKRWVGLAEPISWNQPVPYEIHALYSLHWRDLLTLLYPGATPESHTTAFLGLTAATLAFWAILTTWRTRRTQWLTLAGGLSMLYALGAHTPFHRMLYEILPVLDKARTPARGLFLFALAISALAAIGAGEILEVNRVAFAALVGGVAVTMFAIARLAPLRPMHRLEGSNYLAYAAIAAALLCIACYLPACARSYVVAAAILLELLTVTSLRRTSTAPGTSVCVHDLLLHDALAQSLRAQSGRFAIQGEGIRTSFGDLYQIDQFTSFVAAVPAPLLDTPAQELLGISRVVHPDGSISVQKAYPRALGDATVKRYVDGTMEVTVYVDSARTNDSTIAHEHGHVKDARENTKQFFEDGKKTKKERADLTLCHTMIGLRRNARTSSETK